MCDEEWDFGFPREIVDSDLRNILNCNYADKAATALSCICWSDTAEGFDYWLDVRSRLLRILGDGY